MIIALVNRYSSHTLPQTKQVVILWFFGKYNSVFIWPLACVQNTYKKQGEPNSRTLTIPVPCHIITGSHLSRVGSKWSHITKLNNILNH